MSTIDRRSFLKGGLGAAGLVGVASSLPLARVEPLAAAPVPPPKPERFLVVVDMAGGNDGYSMVIPANNGVYRKLRPTVRHPNSQSLPFEDGLRLHPSFVKLSAQRMAVLEGVGTPTSDLSHFEMLRRWWQGDEDGSQGFALGGTGFLGRLCDVVGDPAAPAAGVSVGVTPSAMLVAQQVQTQALEPSGTVGFPGSEDPVWMAAQQAMADPEVAETNGMLVAGRRGNATALRVNDLLAALPPPDDATFPYPGTGLGAQLRLASRIVQTGTASGVRCIHVPFHGDFDTHVNHKSRHSALMTEFDDALDVFLREIKARGLLNHVVVATISEFGRRLEQNTNGLDHGTASAVLLFGAVRRGVFGDRPKFSKLDSDGNLRPTVMMSEYYASLAKWMGARPDDVLPGAPAPISGMIRYR